MTAEPIFCRRCGKSLTSARARQAGAGEVCSAILGGAAAEAWAPRVHASKPEEPGPKRVRQKKAPLGAQDLFADVNHALALIDEVIRPRPRACGICRRPLMDEACDPADCFARVVMQRDAAERELESLHRRAA